MRFDCQLLCRTSNAMLALVSLFDCQLLCRTSNAMLALVSLSVRYPG
jgi:hypothetical protein